MLCVSLSDFESPYKGGWGGGEDNRNEEKSKRAVKEEKVMIWVWMAKGVNGILEERGQ